MNFFYLLKYPVLILKKIKRTILKFLSFIFHLFIILISYFFIKEKIKVIKSNNNNYLLPIENFNSQNEEVKNILMSNEIVDIFSKDYWGNPHISNIAPLFSFIKEKLMTPKIIIEIGTGYGASALHMRKIFNNSSIITIEPPKGSTSSHWSKKIQDHSKVIDVLNLNKIISFEGTSNDFENSNQYKEISNKHNNDEIIIFVDGDHNMPLLALDYVFLKNLLKKHNGKILIIFDDYYHKDLSKVYEFFSSINPQIFDKSVGYDVYRISNSIENNYKLNGMSFFKDSNSGKSNFSIYKSYFNCFRVLKNF